MLLADRPTTSRWAPPPTEANTPYQVRPILEGKNRGRHFARKTPSPGSQIALEPDLGSASDPTRTVARAGTHNATPGLLLLSRPLGPRYCNATNALVSAWTNADDSYPREAVVRTAAGRRLQSPTPSHQVPRSAPGKGLPFRARERRKQKRWIDGRSGDKAATRESENARPGYAWSSSQLVGSLVAAFVGGCRTNQSITRCINWSVG